MSGRKKPLDEKEIEAYLTQLEDGWLSEDGIDDEDSDDEMHYADKLRRYLEEENGRGTVVADMIDETLDSDPPLVQEEQNKEFTQCSCPTVQQNRIANNKLPDRKTFMKKSVPQGSYKERVSTLDGVDMSCVAWMDNKEDLAVINGWVIYRKNAMERKHHKKNLLTMSQFRNELAFIFCDKETSKETKQGHPSTSTLENELQSKRKKASPAPPPPKDIRTDGAEHWPTSGWVTPVQIS